MPRLAGMCARRRTYFSLRRQRKVGKRKATPLAVSLRFASGNLRCSRAGRCCGTRFVRCAHAAQTTAASQITMHGHTALPMPAPRPALLGTARGDLNSNTGHCCARPRQQPTPRPSAAMARIGVQVPSGRAEKRRAWGGHGQRSMPMRRDLTCCGCLSAVNEVNAASSAAPPRARASLVARSEAKGRGQWGRLFFAYFLLAAQKKVGAPPGAYPGQRELAGSTEMQTTAYNSNAAAPHPSPLPRGAREQGSACEAGQPRDATHD